ncbi:hypothetical protein ACIBUR_39385 [Streptomyces anulatus]
MNTDLTHQPTTDLDEAAWDGRGIVNTPAGPQAGGWKCRECDTVSDLTDRRCIACDTARPEAGGTERRKDLSQLPSSVTLPLDLEQLPTDVLLDLFHTADRILMARNEAQIPKMVRHEVSQALAESEPDAPEPVSARVGTWERENGICWDEGNVHVLLADGSTRNLDLSGTAELPRVLSDHAQDWEPNDCSALHVVFEPLALNITD